MCAMRYSDKLFLSARRVDGAEPTTIWLHDTSERGVVAPYLTCETKKNALDFVHELLLEFRDRDLVYQFNQEYIRRYTADPQNLNATAVRLGICPSAPMTSDRTEILVDGAQTILHYLDMLFRQTN